MDDRPAEIAGLGRRKMDEKKTKHGTWGKNRMEDGPSATTAEGRRWKMDEKKPGQGLRAWSFEPETGHIRIVQ
jgi:hypothetical protein